MTISLSLVSAMQCELTLCVLKCLQEQEYVFTLQPSGLEGYCRHGSGGRAAAKLAEPISL